MKTEKIDIKKDIRYCDIITWITFAMLIFVRFITTVVFHITANISQTSVQSVIQIMEVNPLAKMAFSLQSIGMMLQFFIVPALFLATYYLFRRRTKQEKISIDSLLFFVNFGFFIMLINIFNDLSTLMGLLAR